MSDNIHRAHKAVLLIAMKGTLDRMDSLLELIRIINNADTSKIYAELKTIRDDVWYAWFEMKDRQ